MNIVEWFTLAAMVGVCIAGGFTIYYCYKTIVYSRITRKVLEHKELTPRERRLMDDA